MRKGYFTVVEQVSAIPVLDGLRAIAIWLVIFRHGVRPFFSPEVPLLPLFGRDAATILINGWAGVDLFFVISGFLITYHVLQRWNGRVTLANLRGYFRKRVLRIFPAYYAVIFVLALGLVPLYRGGRGEEFLPMLLIHLLYLQDYFPSTLLVAAWSLGVEEKFYLVTPLVMALLFRLSRLRSRLALMLALSLIPLALRGYAFHSAGEVEYDYYNFFLRYRAPFHHIFDGFYLGGLVALLYDDRGIRARFARSRTTAAIGVAGVLLVVGILFGAPYMEVGLWRLSLSLYYLLPLGFAAIAFACMMRPSLVGGLLMNRPLYFFSRISYSWYLVHLPLVPLTLALARKVPGMAGEATVTQFALFLPIYVAVTLAAALTLHFTVEKPFLILKDR